MKPYCSQKSYWIGLISIILLLFIQSGVMAQGNAEQYKADIERYEKENNKLQLANTLNKLGLYYFQQNKPNEAVEPLLHSLELNVELGNENAQRILSDYLGLVYSELEDYPNAIKYFTQSLGFNLKRGNANELISNYYNLALACQSSGNYAKSNEYAELAAMKSIEVSDLNNAKSSYLILAENYEQLGNPKQSAEYFDKYSVINKKLQQEQLEQLETEKELVQTRAVQSERELQSARDTLKVKSEQMTALQLEQERIEFENQKRLAEQEARRIEEDRKRKSQLKAMAVVIGVILIILLSVYFQNQQKKKANKILQTKNDEIEKQKEEIEKQRDLVTKQKKNLTDSIQYARRIQSAVIPNPEKLTEICEDNFILYRPRDIVSGDFYWFVRKDNVLIITAADCTGHGVPGAFMSMLGVAYLNEIVNKIAINAHFSSLHSDEILNALREKVILSLHQTGDNKDPKDGMDMSLCIIDFEKRSMEYSGAYNPLLIFRKGELIRYNADKMPVSFHKRRKQPFARQNIKLEPNDRLYLFSDGYIDQFGGPERKKFLMKQFIGLLSEIYSKPMKEQKEILDEAFDNWKGDSIQIDDVLVIGINFQPAINIKDTQWSEKTILIAEDTDINYILIAEVLKNTNATLLRVKNGAEAVEKVKDNKVDLVLMDINMPIMDGYEATRLIKEFNKQIPVIIQTAVLEDGKEKASEAGADDFISKPIDLKTFMQKISMLIN